MKKFASILLAALLCVAAVPASLAQTFAPRDVANHIADRVAENYWSPERGAQYAQTLRDRAASGAFDRITDPRELGATIAATLNPFDHHFQVQWAPPDAQTGAPPPQDPARIERQLARSNYGFLRAEMLPGGVGYIDVRAFADFDPGDAETSPARRAADAAMTMIAGADAVVVDLRDSQGGSPAMVGYLAAYFVPQGANIYNTFHSRGPDQSEAPFVEPRGARMVDVPLFIITSGRTASASESFAYTLQAAGRATIVGEPSAGGANPGGFIPAGDGFSVFVSGATPENPITHRNWEGDGVPVNVAAPNAESLTRAHALALQAIIAHPRSDDAALEAHWALDALNAANTPQPRNLGQYAGDYGTRSIAVENGHLVLHRDRRPGIVLLPIGEDAFAAVGVVPLTRVHFERDPRGRVSALSLSLANGPEFRDAKR